MNNLQSVLTLAKIRHSLYNNLKEKYSKEISEKKLEGITDEILKVHGLVKDNFDFIKSVETLLDETLLNDVSVDDNSNKNEKTVERIFQESVVPIKKTVGYDYLYRKLKELYGKDAAKKCMGEMFDLSLGLADSSGILKPYCYGINASEIVLNGRPFGQLKSKPSKRISSYVSALCETIHQMSSHLAGAMAIGSLFFDFAHLSLYKEKYDLVELKTNKKFRKELENEFQQFVHSVNHLSRNGIESPFTNISIFDRPKIRNFIKEMEWYFPIDQLPIEHPKDLETEEEQKKFYSEYIVEYVMELQQIFLAFFNQGDPLAGGRPYRFPIVTVNISRKQKNEEWIIDDSKFLKMVCKLDIYRYNIFTSEGNKIASCCRLSNDSDLMSNYASQANSFGAGGSISLGSHRVCTINFMRLALEAKSMEDFYKKMDERTDYASKILKAHKELLKDLTNRGLQPFIKNGWININRLFSTFGVLGIYEAVKELKQKFSEKGDIEKEILEHLNKKVWEKSKEYAFAGNIEQIPGESFAVRLAAVDKLIYGDKLVPYEMYANQWVPLWEDVSIWKRMDKDGKYNKLLTGGGICHITIGEKVTSRQAENIIKYAVKANCEHFALNSIYSECKNSHITLGKFEMCPECKEKIVEYYQRIVGYFVPVSSWNKIRREWEFPKRAIADLKEVEDGIENIKKES